MNSNQDNIAPVLKDFKQRLSNLKIEQDNLIKKIRQTIDVEKLKRIKKELDISK